MVEIKQETKIREISNDERSRKEAWREIAISDRLKYMASLVVPHPQFTRAVNEIIRRSRQVVAQEKGNAFCVQAETGGGKTTLAKTLQRALPDIVTSELTIRRVVYFNVPPRASSLSMSSALLRALGDPRWEKRRADVTPERAHYLLRACKTEIILLDNTHDIPERRAAKGVREVGNWIRDVVDKVPALFVSLGAKQGMDVFKANNQARRRSSATVKIDYFNYTTPIELGRLMRFLFELDIRLPLAEMSGLATLEIVKRIGVASHGIPDYIIKILTEALECAVSQGRESIAWDDLYIGCQHLYEDNCSDELNPFSPSASLLRRLDREGEPFESWLDDGYV